MRQFSKDVLLRASLAGVMSGIFSLLLAISFAALIFREDLSPYLGLGTGLALASLAAMSFVNALTSDYPGMVSAPQSAPAAVASLMSLAVLAAMPGAPIEAKLVTVLALMIVSTLVIGGVMLMLGVFKLGALVRYVPYPVIGGFLAGTGWLMFTGGLGVALDQPMNLAGLPGLFSGDLYLRWLPALIFSIILVIVSRRIRHFAMLPGLVLVGVIVFYIMEGLSGRGFDQTRALGVLLGPFPDDGLWQPFPLEQLQLVRWDLIVRQLPALVAGIVVCVVSVLLNASGLELIVGRDIDLNRTLTSTGWSNLAGGLVGGFAGFPALSYTALAYRMGSVTRWTDIFKGLFVLALLLFGTTALSVLPKPVLGGLVMYLGLSFLVEWVYDAWSRLPRNDYAVVIFILVTVAAVGYLEGVFLGLMAAVALFAFDSSRVNVIRHELTLRQRQSSVVRSPAQQKVLHAEAESVYILELQGFVFFGTINHVVTRIRQRLLNGQLIPLRYVIIDVRQIQQMDTSAVTYIGRLKQIAQTQGFSILITHARPELLLRLAREQISQENSAYVRIFGDLDRALEWCEDQLILEVMGAPEQPVAMVDYLASVMGGPTHVERLLAYMSCEDVTPGQVMAEQGAPTREFFFIERGRLNVFLEDKTGQRVRLRSALPGAVLGEIGAFLGVPRSASIVAEGHGRVYQLSVDALERMRQDDPVIALAFHEFMARVLAARLADTTATLQAVL